MSRHGVSGKDAARKIWNFVDKTIKFKEPKREVPHFPPCPSESARTVTNPVKVRKANDGAIGRMGGGVLGLPGPVLGLS